MAKRRREMDNDITTTATAEEHNTVFVDTSLGTHLAMMVSNFDTVSDFKKKIVLQHIQCFPEIGDIQILSMKVKRKGNFYHLPDIMRVWSAFHGSKGNWFLSVDACEIPSCYLDKKSSDFGTSNGVNMDLMKPDDNCKVLSSDANRIPTLAISLPDGATQGTVVPEMDVGFKLDKTWVKTTNSQINNNSDENHVEFESPAKKKRKLKHDEVACHNTSSTVIQASRQDKPAPMNSTIGAAQESSKEILRCEQQGAPNICEETAKGSGVTDGLSNSKDGVDGQDKEASFPPKTLEQSVIVEPEISGGYKKKKMKKKMEKQFENDDLDKLCIKQADNGGSGSSGVLFPSTDHISEEIEKGGSILYGEANADQMKLLGNSTAEAGKEVTDANKNEADFVMLTPTEQVLADVTSGEREMWKETQCPADNRRTDFLIVEKENQIVELNHSEINSKNSENKDRKTEKKKKRELSTLDVRENLPSRDQKVGSEVMAAEPSSSFVKPEHNQAASSQVVLHNSEQSLEQMHETSIGINSLAGPHEKEGEGISLSIESKVKKIKRKKKIDFTPFDVQETLPTKDKKFGIEVLAAEENLSSLVNPEHEQAASSQVLLHNNEEKLEQINETAVGTNSMAGPYEIKTKKTKKRELNPSDVQENLPSKDQEARVEVLAAEENSSSFVDPQHEQAASSQVILHKSEEKLEQIHGTAVGTISLAGPYKIKNKKKKKRELNPSHVLENLPNKDQVARVEVLAAEEISSSFVNPQHEQAASSQDVLHKTEEKLEQIHETAVRTNSVAGPNEMKTKKKKKRELNPSDVPENLPNKDQEARVEVLAAAGNSSSFVNPQHEQAPSSEIVLHKSEEKLVQLRETATGTNSLAGPYEREGEVISFNTENKVKKTKKRKKREVTASDAQENLPAKDQNIHVEVLAAEENSSSFVNPEHDQAALSQIVSQKTEEKLEEMHETAVITNNLAGPVEKEGEGISFNPENKVKKTKKKMKRELTATGVQENFQNKDEKVNFEVLAAEDILSSFVNPEHDQAALSQVVFHESEKKLEQIHEIGGDTDSIAATYEKEDEQISFKQYFVPRDNKDKFDLSNQKKKLTKSNELMKSGKKVKAHVLPSVSISTELQNSLKPFGNQESGNKSHVRKASARRNEDLAANSDHYEVNPNSIGRSSGAGENGVNDSSPREMVFPKKQNKVLDVPSRPREKNVSLDKSSLEKSNAFPENRGNKRMPLGLNVTNKMVTKTPTKKSLLSKSGTIFQDNSGESSGDENGTMHSDASTRTPSDNSSLSGNSDGESDLSQDSTRNGSSDMRGRSTSGKTMSMSDPSALKDMTMDMILRSSKRFKKAKLQVSQKEFEMNESEVEMVPESQPGP